MTEPLPARELSLGGILVKDRVFWFGVVVFTSMAMPMLFPLLEGDALWKWRNLYADVPLYAVALLAILTGLKKMQAPREKRFWGFVAFAFGAVLVDEIIIATVPLSIWNNGWELATQTIYLAYYLGLALSLEALRWNADEGGGQTLRWFRTVGVGILLVALLVYAEILPNTLQGNDYVTWGPALLIYVGLDVILFSGFVQARMSTTDHRWKRILGGMALVTGSFAIVDLGEAALYVEPLVSNEPAPIWDLFWFAPVAIMVVVARRNLLTQRVDLEPSIRTPKKTLSGGPLVA
ncbi:MAG: hypothetical protein ACE5FJ_08075, partial [Gemmatimonadales bacterium]